MLKIAEKDKDFVYIYSENLSEISKLMPNVRVACTTTYKNYPAIIVRKEKEDV